MSYVMRFGEGFAPDDTPGPFGNFHINHEAAKYLRRGDKIVIEAEVQSANMIGVSQLCADGLWRPVPHRVVYLKSGFSVRKFGDPS